MTLGKALAVGAAIVAALAVATSIWLNSPTENRARAMDGQRVWQLRMIERAIDSHYKIHEKLPSRLEELATNNSLALGILIDPGTEKPFEYEIVSEKDYRLCAIFERSTEDERNLLGVHRHKAGRNCFDREAEG